jgi:Sigma-70, region 4
MLYDDDPPEPLGAIDDERLRLIFTCCHPALAMETRVALTLRMVGGLTVPEIARAFLVQEAAMGQRITRAKARPSRSPSLTDGRWHWRPSTVCRTSWPAITPTMRPAPTCCAGWAAVRSRARRTTKPSSWQATPPRPPT